MAVRDTFLTEHTYYSVGAREVGCLGGVKARVAFWKELDVEACKNSERVAGGIGHEAPRRHRQRPPDQNPSERSACGERLERFCANSELRFLWVGLCHSAYSCFCSLYTLVRIWSHGTKLVLKQSAAEQRNVLIYLQPETTRERGSKCFTKSFDWEKGFYQRFAPSQLKLNHSSPRRLQMTPIFWMCVVDTLNQFNVHVVNHPASLFESRLTVDLRWRLATLNFHGKHVKKNKNPLKKIKFSSKSAFDRKSDWFY